MKKITKYFSTLMQAERFLNSLYNQYNHVQIIDAPFLSDSGYYTFEVK